jgi:two-component system response regulator RegA
VLLVDDDAAWLRACERAFRDLGYTVHVAMTVDGARVFANEHPPDLVISEIRISGESGVPLIDAMRRTHPGCAIAIVSAYLSTALTAVIVRKGVAAVLFKPVHPSEIVRRLCRTDPANPANPADPAEPAACDWVTPTLARAEWEHINRVLMDCNGNVSEAARRLGILRQSLQRRLRKHAPTH